MHSRPTPCTATTRLIRNLLRLHGHPAEAFVASCLDDGSVCVRGPGAFASYRPEAWTSKFVRHLCAGYFDPRPALHPQRELLA